MRGYFSKPLRQSNPTSEMKQDLDNCQTLFAVINKKPKSQKPQKQNDEFYSFNQRRYML